MTSTPKLKTSASTLSSRGQVVVPEYVRKKMKLEKGDVFTFKIIGKNKIEVMVWR